MHAKAPHAVEVKMGELCSDVVACGKSISALSLSTAEAGAGEREELMAGHRL